MKKFRQRILEMKEGFLSGKREEVYPAYRFANLVFIYAVFLVIFTITIIVGITFPLAGICMNAISFIFLVVFVFWDRAFFKTMPISVRIFMRIFGRYGRVVTKDDWKRIKKKNKRAYKFIWDKTNIGHCYAVAWILALRLKDAKVMYCSIAINEDKQTAHAVVVKNNCIYDTNLRMHFDYDEYIEMNNAEVYQIFEEEVYRKKSFFDDVRQGFVDWCAERNVYCDPQ